MTSVSPCNLVTNLTWEHFWLNEGFTVFIERKIMHRMYGRGFHSSTSQLNLSRFLHLIHPKHPLVPPKTS